MKNNRTLFIGLAFVILAVLAYIFLTPTPQQPADETATYMNDTIGKMPPAPATCPCDSVIISQRIVHRIPAGSSAKLIEVYTTVTCKNAPWVGVPVRIKGAGINERKATDATGAVKVMRNMHSADSTGATITSEVICTSPSGVADIKTSTGTVPAP